MSELSPNIAEAREAGATVLETYPVDPESPSYRFGGFVSIEWRDASEYRYRVGASRVEQGTAMTTRTDTASKVIHASAPAVYRAFAAPGAMERWLPPTGMTGTMLSFDFRQGGSYRMRLKHENSENAPGKTTADTDEVYVRINRLVADERIEQSVTFESDDPRLSGEMRITWSFTPVDTRTLVEVRCDDVPEGICREDHQAGLNASLRNLAAFVEAGA